jgi:hypothetical protein
MKNAFKGHRKDAKIRKYCVYTVYENKTDRLVCLDADANKAAAAMGISLSSFHSTYSRINNGTHKKWTILKDFCDEIEETYS